MEAKYVMSPSGARFPRTPANVAAFEKEKGSNEKPGKKKDAVKVEVEDEVEMDELKMKLKMKMQDEDELKVEVEAYREKMEEMEGQLQMMEGLMERNEQRFVNELEVERERRSELEARLGALKDDRDHNSLQVRELELREKEYYMAEKKMQRAETEEANAADGGGFDEGLSISDPAGDVVIDLSMMRLLEKSLRDEKNSTTTISALLESALARHADLRDILAGVGEYSTKFVLQKFKHRFKSLFRISKSSLSVVAILVMNMISDTRAKAAVKFAGSRVLKQLLRDTPSAVKSGSIPALDESLKLMSFYELPGSAELLGRSGPLDIEEHWAAIESFVAASVCYVRNVKGKLAAAIESLDALCGDKFTDAGAMLARYNVLFDVCTSWLGTPFEGDYKKNQRFLEKCPAMVQEEYAVCIAPKYDGVSVDELTMCWSEFETLITRVWDAASVKNDVRSALGLIQEYVEKPDSGSGQPKGQSYRRPAAAAIGAPIVSPLPTEGADKFKDIVCVECQKSFIPSSRQVEKFEATKIPLPDRCPKCKGQICDTFKDTGACPYAENCKFLHPEKVAGDVSNVKEEPVVKHSYPCRFHAVGRCLSGENCKFQHGDKPGAVFSMSEAEPEVVRLDYEASIQDTNSRFPPEVMMRPKRKVVTNFESDDDD